MPSVIVRSEFSLRNDVEIGDHRLILDEPLEAGGTNFGPTPYDMVAAGLGGCTSMTMHVVAKREKIPLTGVEVRVSSDRIYAKDCADCNSKDGYIHRFTVVITLLGDLTEAQRDRMLTVARRCPVAKTLMAEIKIEESLAAAQ